MKYLFLLVHYFITPVLHHSGFFLPHPSRLSPFFHKINRCFQALPKARFRLKSEELPGFLNIGF
jgi:hypothetical protein